MIIFTFSGWSSVEPCVKGAVSTCTSVVDKATGQGMVNVYNFVCGQGYQGRITSYCLPYNSINLSTV